VTAWTESTELGEVAQAWLASGAVAFGVWQGAEPLVRWPAAASADEATTGCIETPIPGQAVGITLRAYGAESAGVRARLEADARLLGRIASTDAEIEAMADDLVESQDQLVALYNLAHSTRDLLSIDAVLASVTREAARLTRAEGAFAVVDAERPACIVQHPTPTLESGTIHHLLSLARAAGRPVLQLVDSVDLSLPAEIGAVLVAPMELRGEQTAALGVLSRPGRPFASPDLKLVRTLADQAAARIENVLLHAEAVERARFDAEMQLAQRVQMRLQPTSTPAVQGLQAWARSRPALEVGGDFFDLILRPDGSFVMVVGDVSGKGMPSALLMAMTRTVLRGMARFVPVIRSEAMLGRANGDLFDDFSEVGMFATAFVATYHPANRLVTFANAGHSPVIYCPAAGAPRMLEAGSPPLGVLPSARIDAEQVTLGPGDVLVAATDGFSEAWAPDGEMFGYERLIATIQHLASGSAADIGAGLFAAVEAYGGGRPQDDDQTLIVVKGVPA
jgi:sigma-B regulation protein RsbU (phosphoserine phosphatase)